MKKLLEKFNIRGRTLSKWELIIIFEMLFIIISLIHNVDILFLLSFIIWINLMIYALMNIKNRIIYLSFLVTFFVFLLGGQVVYEYFGYRLPHYCGDLYYRHMNIALIISLVTLQIGYMLGERLIKKRNRNILNIEVVSNERYLYLNYKYKVIRNVSKVIFYVASIPWIALMVEKAIFVQNTSYYELYTSYVSSYPYIVLKLAEIAPIMLFIFLATMPTKKECRIPILIFILNSVISLATGRRLFFMTGIMFVIVYFIIRNGTSNGSDKWIGKREIVVSIILLPILVIGLYSYNFIRFGTKPDATSTIDAFLRFFQQQGFSSSLIRLGKLHQDKLSDSQWYSFYGIIKYWRTNTITNLFIDFDYGYIYGKYTAAEAIHGNSLAHSLSYIVLGDRYLNGSGLGSSYVAEAYQDLGYIGIALANFIYGLMISYIWNRNKAGIWKTAVSFILFESLLIAPRYNFDIIFANLLNVTLWLVLLGIWFLSNIIITHMKKSNTC